MAYGQRYSGNANNSTTSVVVDKPKTEALFTTGLWKQEGKAAIGTVQVKETITIPAGSYLNLYENDKSKSKNVDTAPDFRLQIRPGQLKTKE